MNHQNVLLGAFMIYTAVMFRVHMFANMMYAMFMANTPDWTKRYLIGKIPHTGRPQSAAQYPNVVMAKGFDKSSNKTHDITNFITLFLTQHWDWTACNNEGGIQLNHLRNYMAHYRVDLVWICYRVLSANSLGEVVQAANADYILLDLSAPKSQVFRALNTRPIDFGAIKKIVEPMFDEISFIPDSNWE